jgi:protein-disulfide isomerase
MSGLASKSQLTLPNAKRDHIQGPIDAAIALVEYGDYECPYCGQAYPILKAIQERLGERMCFVFRNFPLVNSHPHAQHAAEAAEAAGAQGRFWEMHDLLYENQDALEDVNIAQYAAASTALRHCSSTARGTKARWMRPRCLNRFSNPID